jgi:polyferredoxin
LSFGSIITGSLIYIIKSNLETPSGIRNNGVTTSGITARGVVGLVLAVVITVFYVLLYWFDHVLYHLIRMLDPLSVALRNKAADQWFLYGTFYTLTILIMGMRAILRYRHNRYQIVRTSSVMFFQLAFAYLIPSLMVYFHNPEYYFSYFWPLFYNGLFPETLSSLWNTTGTLGIFLCFWGVMMIFVATPILTYFFGKRWYCSWVCGCGGLSNTLGDPWRQLSDKSRRAWKIELRSIYSVLLFIIVTTALLWLNSFCGGKILGDLSIGFAKTYGFLIGAVFASVAGVSFYPLLGSRIWCRFGCPMAAILGILQKRFSRFRITTNGAQCISCGNCSKYCEMGIDVRWYAQQKKNIVRASCVGCGMCSAVCPRGVLDLENGPQGKR